LIYDLTALYVQTRTTPDEVYNNFALTLYMKCLIISAKYDMLNYYISPMHTTLSVGYIVSNEIQYMTCNTGEDYLPFAEIPPLRNMVLTGEDDGDMSYMRLQQRQLKPGASNLRALPPSHYQPPPQDNGSAVVPYHSGPSQRSEHGGRQDYTSRLDPRIPRHAHLNNRNAGSGHQGKRGGFRSTYD